MSYTSFKAVGVAMSKPARRLTAKRGIYDQNILRHWRDIVGDDLANITEPHSIKSQRHGVSTLTLNCLSAQASEITMRLDEIRIRVNAYIGEDAIAKIKLNHQEIGFNKPKPKPVAKPKAMKPTPETITQKLAQTKNNDLRSALNTLSQSFYNRGE